MSERSPLHREIGRQVARWRTTRGLSQHQLAEKVGCGASTIGRIEAGIRGPSVEMLQALGQTLDVPLRALLPGADADGLPPELLSALKRVEAGDHALILALVERLAKV